MSQRASLLDQAFQQVRLMGDLEKTLKMAHERLKAAQTLRRVYKDSPFALTTIATREKQFKKEFWEASNNYRNFKRTYLGE